MKVGVVAGLLGMVQPAFGFVIKEVNKSGVFDTKVIKDHNLSITHIQNLKVRQMIETY